ncbi:MAG TPA: hypothetical protein VJ846_04090 [Sphingomicrobium sp.]|nr:hypothetical protein [Sphingomicrobium sp.]
MLRIAALVARLDAEAVAPIGGAAFTTTGLGEKSGATYRARELIALAAHRYPAANDCQQISETGEWDNERP